MPDPASSLSKMRRLATGLLVAMVVLFIIARSLESGAPAWAWVRAFAEAALVGALADWFAVTALFRHPLGLPIPHTAIVKKEKARIGEALARFVRGSFLSPEEVARQWRRWQPVNRALTWVSHEKNARKALLWIVHRLPAVIGKKKGEGAALMSFGGKTLRKGFESLPFGKLAAIALQGFLKSPSRRSLIAPILGRLGKRVEENRDWVMQEAAQSAKPGKSRFFDRLSRAATGVVSAKAVEHLSKELVEASKDETHALYQKIEEGLAEAARDFSSDGDGKEASQWADIKDRLLQDQETREVLAESFHRAGQAIIDGAKNLETDGTLDEWAKSLSQAVKKLQEKENDLEEQAISLASHLSTHYGPAVELLISQTVADWEADELIDRLEHQVGPDLQFIRINGTLIGGLIGLLLHGLSKLIW